MESAQGLQIGGPGAESNLLLAFAGGTAPDVVYVNFRSSASYIQQGFLLPLDEELKRDPEVLARIQPTLLPILKDAGHGHIYSIPFLAAVQAALLPKRYVPAGGPGPGQAAAKLGRVYADAQALTDQPKGVWGFEFGTDSDASAIGGSIFSGRLAVKSFGAIRRDNG